jgi:hypothetical protein
LMRDGTVASVPDDDTMDIIGVDISESGEVTYIQTDFIDYSNANADRLDDFDLADMVDLPTLDHITVIKEEHEEHIAEIGLILHGIVWASAPSVVAFAGLIRAYLLRNKKREVHLYWHDGNPRLSVKGDLSVDEIARLLEESAKNKPDGEVH